jgi:hypothetical protein
VVSFPLAFLPITYTCSGTTLGKPVTSFRLTQAIMRRQFQHPDLISPHADWTAMPSRNGRTNLRTQGAFAQCLLLPDQFGRCAQSQCYACKEVPLFPTCRSRQDLLSAVPASDLELKLRWFPSSKLAQRTFMQPFRIKFIKFQLNILSKLFSYLSIPKLLILPPPVSSYSTHFSSLLSLSEDAREQS